MAFTMAQAQKELAALKEAVAARQTETSAVGKSNTDVARAICFTLNLAARGMDSRGRPLSPARLSRAKAL